MAIGTYDLTRSFGFKNAVRGLNLQVPAGSIYGFLGPNGAGKTTTIRLILGLIQPSSGSVFLNGREMTLRPHHEELRNVGALVETPALYPNLTGRENLEVTRRLLDVPISRIDRVLALMELSGDADRTVRSYSLGMRQRLGLALACLGDLAVVDHEISTHLMAPLMGFRTRRSADDQGACLRFQELRGDGTYSARAADDEHPWRRGLLPPIASGLSH
jgi:ABC-type multidrug transport system ATPase subunit